jgi:murein DD-endopeptidase MepM/ murein hydrolase activator NlpD
MLRLVVLTALLTTAAWLAHEAGWRVLPVSLPATTPHDRYRHALERSGAAHTSLGRGWLTAATSAITDARTVTLPAREHIRFNSSSPTAAGFRVALSRGQRLEVITTVTGDAPSETFVDVFEAGAAATDDPAHRAGALRAASHEAREDGEWVVRVQPELLRTGLVSVALRATPALRFPVADARPRDLQSVFGDPRDAGRRQHEGVDIFATRGTHVVSATDGLVTRVGENNLGGRVVWVWDRRRSLMLYYAHLDEQLVTTGTRVIAGEVIGTVGNTGNARTTPPHLHFGIYERGHGAIDPYWFIAPARVRGSAVRR